MTGRFPDFLIVGAARSGTTALHRLLRQHPGVFLPARKEPCFFAFQEGPVVFKKGRFAFAIREEAEYLSLFKPARPDQRAGEASTPYLFLYEQSIAAIQKLVPKYRQTKIIAILRHPIDRAISNYQWRVRDGRESLSFDQAIRAETRRRKSGYSFDYFYAERSKYAQAVEAYRHSFDHVLLIRYDDFVQSPVEVMKRVCRFLEIDDTFVFKSVHEVNRGGRPLVTRWNRWLTWESPWKYKVLDRIPDRWKDALRRALMPLSKKDKKYEVSDETRRFLVDYFQDDVGQLEQLTGWDLTDWKK